MLLAIPGAIGRRVASVTGDLGRAVLFLGRGLSAIARPPFRGREIVEQVHFIGNRSVGILLLTAAFTGMVLTLEGDTALSRFGSEKFIGPVVALGLVRELGPVLASLMVTARAGAGTAAVIANMRVTEQIDALSTMAVAPVQALVAPRLVAAAVTAPVLATLFNLSGIAASYCFGVLVLRLDGRTFMANVRQAIDWSDIGVGIAKALVFALCMAWISTYRGFHASGGAEGVGRATTRAVVEIAALVLVGDYVMTALFF